MTTRRMPTSGTSKPPSLLPYPTLFAFASLHSYLKDRMVYIIRHYGNTGIAVLIHRDPKHDKATVLCGDWAGNNIDLTDATMPLVTTCLKFINNDLQLFLRFMQTIKLDQAQYFFATHNDGLTLVDLQTSLNKLVGPGMIRDVFGNIYKTPEVIKVEVCDDRAMEYIERGSGTYEGELIIKPSRFSVFSHGEQLVPLYGEVKR